MKRRYTVAQGAGAAVGCARRGGTGWARARPLVRNSASRYTCRPPPLPA